MANQRLCKTLAFSKLLFTFTVIAPIAASADGFVFVWRNEQADVFQPSQKAAIYFDGTSETLVVQTKFEGPAQELAWLVPVPSKPTVKKGNARIFEILSKHMQDPDVAYTYFGGYTLGLQSGDPLVWQRRIGAYDVALLSPAGGGEVIRWLEKNEYGVPARARKILRDYVERQWWIVASKVHRDALTTGTRRRLATGTLHPLEITFATKRCVYPMRLTSLGAGPVEVLLYVLGPAHYEPATLAGPQWRIDFKSTPYIFDRVGRLYFHKIDLPATRRCITKLRRTFRPTEMTDEIFFREIDYAEHLRTTDTLRRAVVATQIGRRRLAEHVPLLVDILSEGLATTGTSNAGWFRRNPGDPPPLPHLRSAIWALGEIGWERPGNPGIERALVAAARSENLLVRREAWVALERSLSPALGPELVRRLKIGFDATDFSHTGYYGADNLRNRYSESGAIIGWLDENATGTLRQEYIEAILETCEASSPPLYRKWLPDKAMVLRDRRFIPLMATWSEATAARAACGDEAAVQSLVKDVIREEWHIQRYAEKTGGWEAAGYQYKNDGQSEESLRRSIRRRNDSARRSYPADPFGVAGFVAKGECRRLPDDVRDRIVRLALESDNPSDLYRLYLLSWIIDPEPTDVALWRRLWVAEGDSQDARRTKRLLAVDVAGRWKHADLLASVPAESEDNEVLDTIVWNLARLRAQEAARHIEKTICEDWDRVLRNADRPITAYEWREAARQSRRRVAARPKSLPPLPRLDFKLDQRMRTQAEPYLDYLVKADDDTVYRRLCSDTSLHPNTRFMLLSDYSSKAEWKRSLLAKLVAELESAYPSGLHSWPVPFALGALKGTDALFALWSDDMETSRQVQMVEGLLYTGDPKAAPTVQRAMREIWPRRYASEKNTIRYFAEGRELKFSLERYALAHEDFADFLDGLIGDRSLDSDYRAFVVHSLPESLRGRYEDSIRSLAGDRLTSPAAERVDTALFEIEADRTARLLRSGEAAGATEMIAWLRGKWLDECRKSGRVLAATHDLKPHSEKHPAVADALAQLARDESLPADYRIFAACCCPGATIEELLPVLKELRNGAKSKSWEVEATEAIQRAEAHVLRTQPPKEVSDETIPIYIRRPTSDLSFPPRRFPLPPQK